MLYTKIIDGSKFKCKKLHMQLSKPKTKLSSPKKHEQKHENRILKFKDTTF